MSIYLFSCHVEPQYLPEQSAPQSGIYSFAYTVTLSNTGNIAAQLISRHWIITDANGYQEEVKGLGVVGQQPLLQPGAAFEYSSGSRLRTPTGTMHGHYLCVAEDGTVFEVPIALFVLQADQDRIAAARLFH